MTTPVPLFWPTRENAMLTAAQFLAVLGLMLVLAVPVAAQFDTPEVVTFVYFFGDPVSVWMRPDGAGQPLDLATVFGGAIENATIALRLRSFETGMPLEGYPAEDCWLSIPAAAGRTATSCTGGVFYADGPSDLGGWITFTEPLPGGGWSDQGFVVYLAGERARDLDGELLPTVPLRVNSPDLSGDLQINLTDIILFVPALQQYEYRADLNYDGQVNLSDIIRMTDAVGVVCE